MEGHFTKKECQTSNSLIHISQLLRVIVFEYLCVRWMWDSILSEITFISTKISTQVFAVHKILLLQLNRKVQVFVVYLTPYKVHNVPLINNWRCISVPLRHIVVLLRERLLCLYLEEQKWACIVPLFLTVYTLNLCSLYTFRVSCS